MSINPKYAKGVILALTRAIEDCKDIDKKKDLEAALRGARSAIARKDFTTEKLLKR